MDTTMVPGADDRFAERGREYIKQDKLTRGLVQATDGATRLSGCVLGSKPHPYRVYLTVQENNEGYEVIDEACTCRADSPCKHQYALLIGKIENDDAVLRAQRVIEQADSEEQAQDRIEAAFERPDRIEGLFRFLNDKRRFKHRLSELHSTLKNLKFHEEQHRVAHEFQPLLREVQTLLDRDAYDDARTTLLRLTQFVGRIMDHVHDDANRIEAIVEQLFDFARDGFEQAVRTTPDNGIIGSHNTVNSDSDATIRIQEAVSPVLNTLSYYAEYHLEGKSGAWKRMIKSCSHAQARAVEEALLERARNPKDRAPQARTRYWCERLVELSEATDLSVRRINDIVAELVPTESKQDISVKNDR